MPRILLVEDSEMNRDMLSRRLARRGFEVMLAADGAEGIRRARSDAPDLILMDMSLPEVDGWEATRRLKAAPETRGIPIIALTAHAMAGDREQAMAAGCNDFDTKPVELERLLGKIEGLLREASGLPTRLSVEQATFEHLSALRAFVGAACRDTSEEVRAALELAVDEACTNVIEHGYAGRPPGPISVEVALNAGCARVTIADRGRPFAPPDAAVPDPATSWEERAVGGLGWPLIRKVIDEVSYSSAGGQNRLTLLKRLAPINA